AAPGIINAVGAGPARQDPPPSLGPAPGEHLGNGPRGRRESRQPKRGGAGTRGPPRGRPAALATSNSRCSCPGPRLPSRTRRVAEEVSAVHWLVWTLDHHKQVSPPTTCVHCVIKDPSRVELNLRAPGTFYPDCNSGTSTRNGCVPSRPFLCTGSLEDSSRNSFCPPGLYSSLAYGTYLGISFLMPQPHSNKSCGYRDGSVQGAPRPQEKEQSSSHGNWCVHRSFIEK
ncbi:PREDICTED: uncharacterized protein LOC106149374, partial [Chinchilla lanigera]|uniref:uncharacterized protein LOC106149374 n=1 Tax=Chinchilla lanigera TaxID=34839 RepID=UPI000697D69E